MDDLNKKDRPWIESNKGRWVIHLSKNVPCIIACSENQPIEIHKIYGKIKTPPIRIGHFQLEDLGWNWIVESQKEDGDWKVEDHFGHDDEA